MSNARILGFSRTSSAVFSTLSALITKTLDFFFTNSPFALHNVSGIISLSMRYLLENGISYSYYNNGVKKYEGKC